MCIRCVIVLVTYVLTNGDLYVLNGSPSGGAVAQFNVTHASQSAHAYINHLAPNTHTHTLALWSDSQFGNNTAFASLA